MITPSFGLTATERVLPKLALDFTTASLDSRVTFTRTTGASNPATYVNSSGVITAAANNQPRFDYDPATLTCKGLLIEEARSNSLLRSENYTITWIPNGMTLTNNVASSPSGTVTAGSLVEPSGITQSMSFYQTFSTANSTTYTASIYLKQNTRQYGGLMMTTDGTTQRYAVLVDLSDGTFASTSSTGSPVNPSYKIIDAGNGWWRVAVTVTNTTAGTSRVYPIVSNTASPTYSFSQPSYLGDSKGIYIWGAQLEAGAFATSYIPTTLLPLTRNADVATMTGTNFSDWFNASEGTFVTQQNIFSTASANSVAIAATNGTTNEVVQMYFSNTQTPTYSVLVGGVAQCSITRTAVSRNASSKFAASYKANDFKAASNGLAAGTDTAGSVSSAIDRMDIGQRLSSSATMLNGWMQKVAYYPQVFTSAEVQAFSK